MHTSSNISLYMCLYICLYLCEFKDEKTGNKYITTSSESKKDFKNKLKQIKIK